MTSPSTGSGLGPEDRDEETPEPVVRDKRRIDPETGEVRDPSTGSGRRPSTGSGAGATGDDSTEPEQGDGARGGEGAEGAADAASQGENDETLSDTELGVLSGQVDAEALAAERLADLQRLTAEYANYRRRTEANRELEKDRSVGEVVTALLPVLDDLDRAQKHGDLDESSAFGTIATKLRQVVERLGASAFGAPGDVFDHNEHDALFQHPSKDVTEPVIAEVIETGYRIGDTLLRAAKVVVSVPEE